jgi:hypothetical protein
VTAPARQLRSLRAQHSVPRSNGQAKAPSTRPTPTCCGTPAIRCRFLSPINGFVTTIVEDGLGVLLLASLVEQDYTATQNRDADTCDYEKSDWISRRIASHRTSEPITKIKRLISLRQRQATKPVGPA